MAIRQRPKDNLIGAKVEVDTEVEVKVLLAVGEENHGFQAEAKEGMLEEEWDNNLEEGAMHCLIHLHAMCAGCMAIWPVTVPKAQWPLEEVLPPIGDVLGKEREKNGNEKETRKNSFLSFPVPQFFNDLFFPFLAKIVKNG